MLLPTVWYHPFPCSKVCFENIPNRGNGQGGGGLKIFACGVTGDAFNIIIYDILVFWLLQISMWGATLSRGDSGSRDLPRSPGALRWNSPLENFVKFYNFAWSVLGRLGYPRSTLSAPKPLEMKRSRWVDVSRYPIFCLTPSIQKVTHFWKSREKSFFCCRSTFSSTTLGPKVSCCPNREHFLAIVRRNVVMQATSQRFQTEYHWKS